MGSPMTRSLAWCRERGMTPWIVERNIHGGIKIDLFHFGDILAVDSGLPGSLIIQTTTGSNMANRATKIKSDPKCYVNAVKWLTAGNRITVHGWRKIGAHGKRKLWELKEEWITLDNFSSS